MRAADSASGIADRFGDLPAPEPGDLIPSLSPRQVLGGFVLLAAAVVVLRRLGRSRGDQGLTGPMPPEPPIDVPRHLFEAYERLTAAPATPIAGGTDLMVRITGEIGAPPDRMLDLSHVEELKGITLEAGSLVLGARTTYTDIRRSALVRAHLPALVEAAATIGAIQIQNRGTLGGNIANASPAGDTLPILLATDAMILVGGQRGEREIAAKDFFVAYRKTALAPDELILHVRFPLPAGRQVRFRKVGTRRAQAISKVVLALVLARPRPRRLVERPGGARERGRDPGPGGRDGAGAGGQPSDARGRRRSCRDARGGARADRRRPLDRRIPPHRRGPDPAPRHPRGRRVVSPGAPPSLADLDALDSPAFAAQLAPLFEGAPRFLARLAAGRPYGSWAALFTRAREIAHAMPEAEQLELVDAHPRLGAPRERVSTLSYREQGYDRGPAAQSAADDPVGASLARLNDAYEARFGFRFCVFVAGRPPRDLLPAFEAALAADRGAELHRALDAVIDIAAARQQTLWPDG